MSRAQIFCILLFTGSAFAQKTRAPYQFSKPNVVLITIDTVRADHLGCYGFSKIQTPTLDGLAQDGILFERAIAQVPLTWPSHTAILTGMYPFQNGVQDFTGQPLDPRFRSVAQVFKQNGYRTAAIVSAFVLDRSWGLARGFDFYDDAFSPESFQTKEPGLVDRRAEESVRHAIHWLTTEWQAKLPRRPFFLWLHLYDPHSPYDPPEPYRSRYRDRPYDGEIAYADHELGRLTLWLKRKQLYDPSLIIATSDHGESLGEHGEQEHGFFIYSATVRVPLIVKPPARQRFHPGRRTALVETTAIAPTLLRLAGLTDEIENQFSSPALLDARSNNALAADRPAYSETFYPFSSFGWSPLHSVETGHFRYIDAPRPELYDEAADPAEKNNLLSQQPATAAVLKEKLQSILRVNAFTPGAAAPAELSPDTQEKLRALGYVSFGSPVSAQTIAAGLPDPKDKIEEFNSVLSAQDNLRLGNFSVAEQLLAKIQEQDPKMYIVPFIVGEAAARRKDWQTSAREFQKCLQLNRSFDQAMTGLARALFKLGDADGAKRWAKSALQINPQNWRAWYELGSIELKTDKTVAIADYEKAAAIQANFALLQRDLGMAYFEQQDYGNAAVHLAKASELGIHDAPLFNFLGIAYDRTGRLPQAIETYRHALQLDENLAEAHLNLGYTYHRLGRDSLASHEYQRACELNQDFCRIVHPAEEKKY